MIVVTGADGQLGTAFRRVLGPDSVFLTRRDLDLTDSDGIAPLMTRLQPATVINCAAYTAVDRAEADRETVDAVNGRAVGELAAACAAVDARFVTISTDYVFDGTKTGPYVESDDPRPINTYGRSKLLGEQLAIEANPETLVVRSSWLLSSTHPNFVKTILVKVQETDVRVVSDQSGSPTIVADLARSVLEAVQINASGILHIANRGVTTWYDLACEAVDMAGLDVGRIQPCSTEEYPTPAPRPANSALASERLNGLGLSPMPHYRESLRRVVSEIVEIWA